MAALVLLFLCAACAGPSPNDPNSYEYNPDTNKYVLKKSPGEPAWKSVDTAAKVYAGVYAVVNPIGTLATLDK